MSNYGRQGERIFVDTVDMFAQEAVRFMIWAQDDTVDGVDAVHTALLRISLLYVAALQLPPPWSDELDKQPEVARLDEEEFANVVAYKAIPFDMYSEVFDPLIIPPEVATLGSIIDDIIDIYNDVVRGLHAYQNGNCAGALWEWSFCFTHHWGEHATGAIRALHAWLTANAVNLKDHRA